MSTSTTHRLATFICQPTALSPRALHEAQRALLDTLAVTLAAGNDPAVAHLEAALEPRADGACQSPWSGRRYGAADGAMLYGMASHFYDYDDVSMLAVCHPSAPVVSALVAAQQAGLAAPQASGHDFVASLAVGTEVLIRIGQAMGFRHYELGFHATSTLGSVGAAAAVAHLARLPVDTTRHALAIAASMASGLRKNFGSTVKPLHVGLAAASGVRAVRMALAGLQGAPEIFDAGGYLQAYSGAETDHMANDLSLGAPYAIESPGFEQKRYPCCYMLHKMIEATLHLRRTAGCTLDDVAQAHVSMPRGATKPLIHPYPRSGLNAKFSGPYAVAASLADGRIDLASFTDEAVARDALQQRLRDVCVEEAPETPPPSTDLGRLPVTVRLNLRDGRVLSHTVVAPPGSPEDPMTLPQLRQKWVDCVRHGMPQRDPAIAPPLFDRGLALDQESSAGAWLSQVLEHSTASRAA